MEKYFKMTIRQFLSLIAFSVLMIILTLTLAHFENTKELKAHAAQACEAVEIVDTVDE